MAGEVLLGHSVQTKLFLGVFRTDKLCSTLRSQIY